MICYASFLSSYVAATSGGNCHHMILPNKWWLRTRTWWSLREPRSGNVIGTTCKICSLRNEQFIRGQSHVMYAGRFVSKTLSSRAKIWPTTLQLCIE